MLSIFVIVEATRFELATSASLTQRSSQAEPRLDFCAARFGQQSYYIMTTTGLSTQRFYFFKGIYYQGMSSKNTTFSSRVSF